MLIVALFVLFLITTPVVMWARFRRRSTARRVAVVSIPDTSAHRLHRPKPPWVRKEIIRLAALMPTYGCRKIADVFDRLHADTRSMTVGKSLVANVIKAHQLDILRQRRAIKHHIPRPMPRNLTWGLDLTFVNQRPILGAVDHGSRACLDLRHLVDKATLTILRAVLDIVEHFGRPRSIRTDNEAMFRSWLFRGILAILGIRHQRTERMAPWQNGRVERFFGTSKQCLRRWNPDRHVEQDDLDLFRGWYNHVRPHQHLGGRTPAEVWNPDLMRQRRLRRRKPIFVSMWDSVLTGFLL